MAQANIPRPEERPARIVKPKPVNRPPAQRVTPQPLAGMAGAGETQCHPGHPVGTGNLQAGQQPTTPAGGAVGNILAGQFPAGHGSGQVGDVAAGQHPSGVGAPGTGDLVAGQQPKTPAGGRTGNLASGEYPKGHA